MNQADFDSLVPPSDDFNRRRFVRSALGSGFAAAALPAMSQTLVKTDETGLTAGEVTVDVGDFKMPVYRAAPTGRSGLPVVLVVSEILGVHEYIADVARRWAKAGYFAIAPELFARQGDPQSYGEVAKILIEIVDKTPDAQVMGDLDACLNWAATQGANTSRSAITGFCWGGRITWLYAAHSPRVKAAVAWYGRLVGAATPNSPLHPVDVAATLRAPVLGLYGGSDTGIALSTVDQMKAALSRGGAAAKKSQIVIYPDAPHAFHADYRPTYRQAAAEDGWRRALAWLSLHGAA